MADAKDTAWSEKKALFLIDAYRIREILWNPKHKDFYKHHLKKDAWSEIAELLSMSAERCNNKMISILSSYRREKLKEKKFKGKDNSYTSRWFAFEALKFLDDRKTWRKSKNKVSLQRAAVKNSTDQRAQHELNPPGPNEHAPQESKRTRRDGNNELNDVLATTAQKSDNSTGIPELTKSFASFIGAKMSSYSSQTRTSVEHAIFEIIMKADRGYYDNENWRYHDNDYQDDQARQISVTYSSGPSTSDGPHSKQEM